VSTDELRRGPGWWMDDEGVWNPPSLWPENTPPLPGWERAADGLWHEVENSVPPPLPRELQQEAGPAGRSVKLGYVEYEPIPQSDSVDQRHRAVNAAAVAAGIAIAVVIVLIVVWLVTR